MIDSYSNSDFPTNSILWEVGGIPLKIGDVYLYHHREKRVLLFRDKECDILKDSCH